MSAHTPGPWTAVPDQRPTRRALRTFAVGAGGVEIATVWESAPARALELGEVSARVDADARLIAAAPELLAACEALMSYVTPTVEALALNAERDGATVRAEGPGRIDETRLNGPTVRAILGSCAAARAAIAKARPL